MKKYVMPVTEIVTVEMPKLLSGSIVAPVAIDPTEKDVENTEGNNVFSHTGDKDISIWGS